LDALFSVSSTRLLRIKSFKRRFAGEFYHCPQRPEHLKLLA